MICLTLFFLASNTGRAAQLGSALKFVVVLNKELLIILIRLVFATNMNENLKLAFGFSLKK